MKNINKTIFKKFSIKVKIFAFSVLAVLIALSTIATCSSRRKNVIAFYNLSEKTISGLEAVLEEIGQSTGNSFDFIVLDSTKKLESQVALSKPLLIFAPSGYAKEAAVNEAARKSGISIPNELIGEITTSMRSVIEKKGGKITALPVLSGHFEIDIDKNAFNNSGVPAINTWKDIEMFIERQKRRLDFPVIFEGKNSDFMLDLFGAFTEAIENTQTYYQAAEILKKIGKKTDIHKIAEELCDNPDSPLITTVKMLSDWYKLGYIHPNAFTYSFNDIQAFSNEGLANVMFMQLETHRTFKHSAISRFASIYFPSKNSPNERAFTGTTVFAVPMKKSRKAELILHELIKTKNEESLSRLTGLAPVLNHSKVTDKQADNARYWITATNAPLAGLSKEAFLTPEQKTLLVAEIVEKIKNRK